MWHSRKEKQSFASFVTDKFRPKLSSNPRSKVAIIEACLSCLEERLLGIEIPSRTYRRGRTMKNF